MLDLERGRVHAVDSLRGIAAIYVVFFHVLMIATPVTATPPWIISKLIGFGGTGVFLFFVISGFSLSLTMPRHDCRAIPTVSYGLSRLFRIAPLFYFVMAILCLAFGYSYVGTKTLGLNLSFLFNLVPGKQTGIVPASWTIGVEMLFYVAFIPIKRARLSIQIATCTAFVLIFIGMLALLRRDYCEWTVVGFFPIFIFGMWSCDLFRFLGRAPRRKRSGAVFAVIGVAILILCVLCFRLPEEAIALRVPSGIGYAILLAGCALTQPEILNSRPLRYCGQISYSIYLLHAPTIALLGPWFAKAAGAFPIYLFYWVFIFLLFAALLPLASITFYLIEKPGDRLGRWVIDLVMPSSPATSVMPSRIE